MNYTAYTADVPVILSNFVYVHYDEPDTFSIKLDIQKGKPLEFMPDYGVKNLDYVSIPSSFKMDTGDSVILPEKMQFQITYHKED